MVKELVLALYFCLGSGDTCNTAKHYQFVGYHKASLCHHHATVLNVQSAGIGKAICVQPSLMFGQEYTEE